MRRHDDGAAAREQQQCRVFRAGRLIREHRDVAWEERATRAQHACQADRERRARRDARRLAEHIVRHGRCAAGECDEEETTRHAQAYERPVEHQPEPAAQRHAHAIARRGRQCAHERTADLAGHLISLVASLLHHPFQHHGHFFRHVGAVAADRHGRLRELLRENGRGGSALERRRAGQHLVEHDAEGVDVGAAVKRVARCLLGTHVLWRPDDHPFAGQLG